jgi:hypothetical protein
MFLDHCQIEGSIRFYKAEGTYKCSYLTMVQNHAQEKEMFFQKGSQYCQQCLQGSESFFAFLYGWALPRRFSDVAEDQHEYVRKCVL